MWIFSSSCFTAYCYAIDLCISGSGARSAVNHEVHSVNNGNEISRIDGGVVSAGVDRVNFRDSFDFPDQVRCDVVSPVGDGCRHISHLDGSDEQFSLPYGQWANGEVIPVILSVEAVKISLLGNIPGQFIG